MFIRVGPLPSNSAVAARTIGQADPAGRTATIPLSQNDFGVKSGRPERRSREETCAAPFKSSRPEALGPGRRYTHWLTDSLGAASAWKLVQVRRERTGWIPGFPEGARRGFLRWDTPIDRNVR